MKKIVRMICIILMIVLIPVNIQAQSANPINTVTVTNDTELVNTIYKQFMGHKTEFGLKCNYDIKQNAKVYIENQIKAVYAIDKKSSSDNDYLRFSIYGYQWSSEQNTGSHTTTYQFQVTYLESSDQLTKVNAKVKGIISSLKLKNASDYQKVKLIHDYLVKKITYDQSYTNYTAYSALIENSAVCQGYSLAAYKLLTEAGIPCRIISGTGNGGDHAWNIVKVNGVWYNLDVTWDDAVGATKILYTNFLKGTDTFYKEHVPDSEYKDAAFTKAYPLSKADYKKN